MLTIEEVTATAELGGLTALLNENRLIGQPVVTEPMVLSTLTRQSLTDQWYYEQLIETHILVLREGERPVGAVAYGTTRSGVRDLLWLTGRTPDTVRSLVDAVFDGWDGPARAFWYAPTVSAGLEGLPRAQRADVHDVLTQRGFRGRDMWSYQIREMQPAGGVSDVGFVKHGELVADNTTVAQYDCAIPFAGIGVLWWLEVDEAYRGRGYGRAALDEALSTLANHGAACVILYVDDDDEKERDRRPAKALYASMGFYEVDRLWSYSRGNLPSEEPYEALTP